LKNEEFYEKKYKSEQEPWEYSKKGVEILRLEFIVNLIVSFKKDSLRILDVGCGTGHLTIQLDGLSAEIYGIDVSETALAKADARTSGKNFKSKFFFKKENICLTSFPENYFDLILLSDGINEWFDDDGKRSEALTESNRILAPGGYVLISDYQKESNFNNYISLVSFSSVKIFRVVYFYDRLCYQFYSWFKALESLRIIQYLFKSRVVAKSLIFVSSLLGRKGAKHLFVVAEKKQ